MENTNSWMTPSQMVDLTKANFNIVKPNDDMNEDDIRQTMRWIGDCSVDTIYVYSEKTKLGSIGIGNMLFVTLMVFPAFYIKHELWQRN